MHNDHDHDHWHRSGPAGESDRTFLDVEGLEQYTLTSVGVDIGSSTSQVMVAGLTIRRRGSDLSTEFEVTEREIRYVSPPLLTPYSCGTRMDVSLLEQFVRESYAQAGLVPERVDTGVVVVTGEALNKENAAEIAALASSWSGDFICVSAGANHEAVLAAHGSGSVALSERENCTVLNVDIGGGTTKVCLIDRGRIVYREAFSVGARLVAWEPDGRIARLEAPAHVFAAQTGDALQLGGTIGPGEIDRLAELMAQVVLDAIVPGPVAGLRRDLMVTHAADAAAAERPAFDRIVFSGGVSEYVNRDEVESYGDFGPALGGHIRRCLYQAGLAEFVTRAEHGIRATVIGASQFSVQASGQTCYISADHLLPVRSLPVAHVEFSPGADPEEAIRVALRGRDRSDLSDPLALAVSFQGRRNYPALRRYAEALVLVAAGSALYLVLRDDLAQALGRLMVAELAHPGPVVVVDGITVGDLDYLDIGRPMGATRSIPVTIKSLAFPR
ncbi:MAG: ethanolamine ammonia-lyase reactivating factor EutA [Mycobacteriales bacterium]